MDRESPLRLSCENPLQYGTMNKEQRIHMADKIWEWCITSLRSNY